MQQREQADFNPIAAMQMRSYSTEGDGLFTDGRVSNLPLDQRIRVLNDSFAAFDTLIGDPLRDVVRQANRLEMPVEDVFSRMREGLLGEEWQAALDKYKALNPRAQQIFHEIADRYVHAKQQPRKFEAKLQNGLSKFGGEIADTYKGADGMAHQYIETVLNNDEAFQLLSPEDQETTKMKYRIATRIAAMNGNIQVFSDFDGTMTDGTAHIDMLPTRRLEEHLEVNDRDDFALYSSTTAHAMMRYKDSRVLYEIGKEHVRFRKGVGHLVENIQKYTGGRNLTILSANFEPVLLGGLENLPEASGNLNYICITPDSFLSERKDLVLQFFARTNPKDALLMFADGGSDEISLEAQDNIAGYFALKDKGFAKKCKARGVAYVTYEDFSEIEGHIDDIMSIVPQMKRYLNRQTSVV